MSSVLSNVFGAEVLRLPANDPRIVYMGRVALDSSAANMGFPGVTLSFVYKGAAPTLVLDAKGPDNYFNLSCNGWDPVVIRLSPGQNRIALPTGKAPASGWRIDLARRTECWMGTTRFLGLEMPEGGELLPAPALPSRKILVIGDSITCGGFIECFPPEGDQSIRSTNVTRTYGMLVARWLNAQVHVVGAGGHGITRDWAGRADDSLLPLLFERAMPDDSKSLWDHSRYNPDLILLNVGTDYHSGVPDAEVLYKAFDVFVARLREVHPKAFIMLCESSSHGEVGPGEPAGARVLYGQLMERLLAHRRELGDTRLGIAKAHYYPGTSVNSHMVAFQHEQLAQELLEAIRPAMGW